MASSSDARRPKEARRTAKALFAEVEAVGYHGGYSRLADFVREWRRGEGQGAATAAFVPLAFELGEACQVDWSEEVMMVGGIYYRLQVEPVPVPWTPRSAMSVIHGRPVLALATNQEPAVGG